MRNSIWPAIHPRILELIREHRSTIVFTNSRRLAERLAQRLNELAGEELVRAHHGSIAREQRLEIEEDLKAGRLPALVATSSLELGIDMGAVDLVIQVESPTSVARGLQRVGRAGHQVGAPSKGVIFPKYRGDLLECAVVTRRMHEGAIETTTIPRNPLDVLAQQLVAMTVMDRWTVDDLLATVTRAAAVRDADPRAARGRPRDARRRLPVGRVRRAQAARRLGPGHRRRRGPARRPGRGGHERRHDPGPRPVRRVHGRRGGHARAGASASSTRRWSTSSGPGCTATSSCSAPAAGGSRRSATTGSRSRPAPGVPGKLPFWKGDAVGRPIELGRAMGAFVRELEADLAQGDQGRTAATARLRETPRPRRAGRRQPARLPRRRARGDRRPADRPADRRRALPRRARRLAALRPDPVRRPGPRAVVAGDRGAARRSGSGSRSRRSGRTTASPSGCPRATRRSTASRRCSSPRPTRSRTWSSGSWPSSALFASRFRENAGAGAAAAAPPARDADARSGSSASARPTCSPSPRATAASRSSSRPTASASSDVFDLPALREILAGVARREIAVHSRRDASGPPRSRAACCSTTSPPTCTTATRRWPSAAPAR